MQQEKDLQTALVYGKHIFNIKIKYKTEKNKINGMH
jgi:hypothetical protein